MDINKQLEILQRQLKVIVPHIEALEKDIALDPSGDVDGKTPRSEVLLEFMRKKAVIDNIIATLTEEQGL
jgi:hypothetical protein